MKKLSILAVCCIPFLAQAETPVEIQSVYITQAKTDDASYAGASAERGHEFFNTKHGKEWSCSSCHTDNPAQEGKHAKTGKVIKPMAPVANAERFSDPAKVAKWFKRMCGEVLGRECTAAEKVDVIEYLLSVK